jgi:hypothetical protein
MFKNIFSRKKNKEPNGVTQSKESPKEKKDREEK